MALPKLSAAAFKQPATLCLPSGLFSWDPRSRTFTAEASTLEAAMEAQGHHRLGYLEGRWGFFMRSQRTGHRVWWDRVREVHRDGDLLHVEYACPELPDLKLLVFND